MQNKIKESNSLQQEERGMVMAQIPPISPDQPHALIGSGRQSQFQLRRQADRYLLILAILLLALAASILWHTASAGITALNVTIPILSAAILFVALRAARSLWLMGQTLRFRSNPRRMSRYTLQLNRLSSRRRHWLSLVLRNSYGTDDESRKIEFFTLRLPSYSIAACLFLLIALNADKAFAATRDYVNVTTTSDKTDIAICDNVSKILEHL